MTTTLQIIASILACLIAIAAWAGGALFSAMWLSDLTATYPGTIHAAAGFIWVICFFVIPLCVIGLINDKIKY